MKIKATIGQTMNSSSFVGGVTYENKTDVNFFYVIEQPRITDDNKEIVDGTEIVNGIIGRAPSYVPAKIPYASATQGGLDGLITLFGKQGLIFMNYNAGGRIFEDIFNYRQYGIMTVSNQSYVNAVSIYKKEIWFDPEKIDQYGNPSLVEEEKYHLVTNESGSATVFDFNVQTNLKCPLLRL